MQSSSSESDTLENFVPGEEVYLGERGSRFKQFIETLLARALSKEYIPFLLTDESLRQYNIAFTSKEANPTHNYEMFEQLGDVSVNKFIVNYMYSRFPQLESPNGVDIIAKLKIKYASKEQLQYLAERAGMWPFITALVEERNKKRKKLLEDTFESFFGVTEYLIDAFVNKNAGRNVGREYKVKRKNDEYIGAGYNIIHRIMKSLFDEIDISLKYEDLVNAKTRFNEVIAERRDEIGRTLYEETQGPNGIYTSRIWRQPPNSKEEELLGTGTAALKKDAQENAAHEALKTLARKYGIIKEAPKRYKEFS